MEGKEYKFKFVCKDFELEVCGDEKFVEQTLDRFESKVMFKLRGLLSLPEPVKDDSPEGATKSAESGKVRPHEPSAEKKSEHRRRRGRRSRKKHHHPSEVSGREAKRKSSGIQQAPGPPKAPSSDVSSPASKQRNVRIDERALRAQIDEKKPRTHHDRIMLFGYHLETHAGTGEFSAEELERCYRLLSEVSPANIQQVLNHATRSGFLIRAQKGSNSRYRLSAKARKYVEDGLRLI
jgi:hypothetical protein